MSKLNNIVWVIHCFAAISYFSCVITTNLHLSKLDFSSVNLKRGFPGGFPGIPVSVIEIPPETGLAGEAVTKVSKLAAKASTFEAKASTAVAAEVSKVVSEVTSAKAAVASNVADVLSVRLQVGTRSIC
ncbi:hypothetical protein GGI35DRAFT_484441 [Trichoderma velutinum]